MLFLTMKCLKIVFYFAKSTLEDMCFNVTLHQRCLCAITWETHYSKSIWKKVRSTGVIIPIQDIAWCNSAHLLSQHLGG